MYPNGPIGPGGDPNVPQNPVQPPVQNPVGQGGYSPQPPQNNMFQIQPEPPVSSKKKALILTLIIAGSVLLIIGAALYIVLAQMQTESVKEEQAKAPLQTAAVAQTVKKVIKEAYPAAVNRDVLAEKLPTATIVEISSAPAYQPDGYQYKVQYDNEAGFTYKAPVPARDLKDGPRMISSIAENALTANDLVLATNQGLKELDGVATKVYTGRDIVCTLSYVNTEVEQSGAVSCGDADQYKKLAAEVQPFAESLNAVTPATTFKNLVTAQSDAGGYQRAVMQVVDEKGAQSSSYFYKTDAGRWLSLTTSNEPVLQCLVFASVEAQRAYLNVPCKDAAKPDAKVQVIDTRR